jgi:class 3 adenylate cyclase/CheY-like chemotaxis protein
MKVLIIQAEGESAHTLSEIFDQFDETTTILGADSNAQSLIETESPDLVVLDLHLPRETLFPLLQLLRDNNPEIKIIISNRYPDLSREMEVKEYGISFFLRAPFNKSRVAQVLHHLEQSEEDADQAGRSIETSIPRVRMPIRFKIILPYLVLALLLAMGAGYVVSRVTLDAIEERFINNLIEVGQLTSSWMVEEEANRLKTLRLITFTDGLLEAIENRDSESLRDLILGIAINNQEDAIDVIDKDGITLISLRHQLDGEREDYDYSKNDDIFLEYEFVQRVLDRIKDDRGDKYSGLIQTPQGVYFYIVGPIINNENRLIGAVLVGRYLPNLVMDIREHLLGEENTFAHVSLYTLEGEPLSTTLFDQAEIGIPSETAAEMLLLQDQASQIRTISVSGIDYQEIIGPWEIRGGQDLGLFGVSLATSFLVRPSQITQIQIFLIATLGFLLIIATGVVLASRITRPLRRVVSAASQVSQGRWNVNVEPQGSDELAYLAHAFNYMVSHLREGEIYRDLLGRTITPQVRDQLRSGLASGNLKLEGQNTIATIMITDIRQFTVIAENRSPSTILGWLNQYYGEIVPIINDHDGVTNEFVGDSVMAFFGILPTALAPKESAFQACKAAVDILNTVSRMNNERRKRDEPPLVTGIGVNTGVVAAGGMGTADRLHYSVIGDSVNVTQRLESLTRELGETSAIISQYTYEALDSYREQFKFTPMGNHVFKGKSEPIKVYRLLPGAWQNM